MQLFIAASPTPVPEQSKPLTVTPLSVHLNVGEPKEFTANGGKVEEYRFKLIRDGSDASWTGDLELIAFNKVRFTPRRPIYRVYGNPLEVILKVSTSNSESVYANIFIHH